MAGHTPRDSSILATLNEAQCRAVSSEAATVAIMAGPGSGKTHTLTSRVAWLVDTVGYHPQNVIVATFTVKAAREMRERIGRALGDGRENRMVLGTFHSIARRYLAAYGKHIGLDQKFAIADDGDSRAIINRLCKRLQLSIDPVQAKAWISKRKAKGVEWRPTPLKRKFSGEAAQGARSFEACYREYQDQLERSNLLDYDDLLVKCVELLSKRPACVSNVEAVLIDEYQDTNGIQYDLMRLLAQKRNRITIVGDPDQSIYGWRSAEIGNLRRLLDDFPGTDQISLEENYRSSQAILDTALNVIQQDSNRYKKILKTVHDKGTRPTLRRLKNSAEEGRWIVSEIRRVQMMSGNMLGYEDVSILLRSASLSRQIESALGKAGIAYRMIGGFKFFERAEIKTLLDYLRVVHQPDNNDALARILNVPKRGIGDTTIKALIEEAERSSLSLWTLLVKHCRGDRIAKTNIKKTVEQKISGELVRLVLDIQKRLQQPQSGSPYGLVDIIDEILSRLGFEKFLEDTYREDHEGRWANVQELRALGNDFTRDAGVESDEQLPEIEDLEQAQDTDVLSRFLANVALASDAQNRGQGQDAKPMVTISTIHAAKGLEWPVVFIPAAYTGSIPHMRSDDADEERRLLYVAMTRAKALLYISCPLISTSYGGQAEVELSSFLEPVARSFAKIGPDLESHKLETIGRILARDVPTQQSIYDGLPGGISPNDDMFPEDPNSNQAARDSESTWAGSSSGQYGRKQNRLTGPAGTVHGTDDASGGRGYSTTMDKASSFTMKVQPGFVRAGEHHLALVSTGENATASTEPVAKKNKSCHTGGQKTLLGFLKNDSKLSKGKTVTPQAASQRSGVSAGSRDIGKEMSVNHDQIEPALSRHRIGGLKAPTRKVGANSTDGTSSGTRYVQFSSSPPNPQTPQDDALEKGNGVLGIDENNNAVPPRLSTTRPASSFHNTTVNMQKANAGFRRPTGLGAPRDEAAALQKLRKPFRPLTINRS